jgi:casein kinase II subunit alpha
VKGIAFERCLLKFQWILFRTLSELLPTSRYINNSKLVYPIGSGKYSVIFLGSRCAVKILKDTSICRIKRELFVLDQISGVPNVVHVNLDPLTQTTSIVTNFVNADNFRLLYPQLSLADIRFYIFALLSTRAASS